MGQAKHRRAEIEALKASTNYTFKAMTNSKKHESFKLWKDENPLETHMTHASDDDDYYEIYDINGNNIGFCNLVFIDYFLNVLKIIYLYSEYRHNGYTPGIRKALVKKYNLTALEVGNRIENPDKFARHEKVARASGFSTHYGILVKPESGANGFDVKSELFIRDDIDPSIYNTKSDMLKILSFNEIRTQVEMIENFKKLIKESEPNFDDKQIDDQLASTINIFNALMSNLGPGQMQALMTVARQFIVDNKTRLGHN